MVSKVGGVGAVILLSILYILLCMIFGLVWFEFRTGGVGFSDWVVWF